MSKVTEIYGDTGEVIERDATAEDLAVQNALQEEFLAAEAIKENLVALKESAKAKLIAGQPLTAEEASVLVI